MVSVPDRPSHPNGSTTVPSNLSDRTGCLQQAVDTLREMLQPEGQKAFGSVSQPV